MSPFHAATGALCPVREGEVRLRLEARPDHMNPHGTVHGGVLATLLDTAAGARGAVDARTAAAT